MSIDHTLSWEVARVGGLLAYLLATVSVVLGLLLSLKARSARWPRFLTNELHRYVTLLSLVFIGVHTLAVWVDPFTGFTPAEVAVPMASHYRPLWIAFGIVAAYLAAAVWLSEYARRWIGYRWWHRFHMLAFVVFVLGTLHGLGAGSDSTTWWATSLYAGSVGIVALLVVLRLGSVLTGRLRLGLNLAVAAAVLGMTVFAAGGPLRGGWNAVANDGNGSGASQAWLAANPIETGPPAPFAADLQLSALDDGLLGGSFGGSAAGQLELLLTRSSSALGILFADGWSCQGGLSILGNTLASRCVGTDGAALSVQLTDLREEDELIVGRLSVTQG